MANKLPRGISVRGNSIILSFTYQGERFRETLSIPPTIPNIKAANRKREGILFEIQMGKFEYLDHFPNSKKAIEIKRTNPNQIIIERALNEWLKRTQNRIAKSTLRGYLSAINYYLIPQFGDIPLSELKATHVKDWLASLEISNKRKNNTLIPLRQVFDDAFHDGIIDKNPMQRVKNLKLEKHEPNPFQCLKSRLFLQHWIVLIDPIFSLRSILD